jgi:RNA-binding protein
MENNKENRKDMLTSKQRASLRALANGIDTVMQIGKGGVTESVVLQARQAISNKELIKVRVLESALLTAREACDILSQAIEAQPVQCIGSRFVLYKRNEENPVIALE